MEKLRAPSDVDEDIYIRHLAIFVSNDISIIIHDSSCLQKNFVVDKIFFNISRESLFASLPIIRTRLTQHLGIGLVLQPSQKICGAQLLKRMNVLIMRVKEWGEMS